MTTQPQTEGEAFAERALAEAAKQTGAYSAYHSLLSDDAFRQLCINCFLRGVSYGLQEARATARHELSEPENHFQVNGMAQHEVRE